MNTHLRIALLLSLHLLIAGCARAEDHVNYLEILSRVRTGDERQHALQELSDAWFQAQYVFSSGEIEDVFPYGPREPEEVTVIGIRSVPRDGHLVVERVGTYDDYKFLLVAFDGLVFQPPLPETFEGIEAIGTGLQ